MKFPRIKFLTIFTALTFAAGCGSSSSSTIEDDDGTEQTQLTPTPSMLVGTWQSDCVDTGDGHIQLTFHLTESTWELDYDAFADDVCQTGFMTVTITGPYELGDASDAVEGARKGSFHFGERHVTPHMEPAAEMLGATCPGPSYLVGENNDLNAGCANLGLYPISDCPTDYDLIKLDGNTLYFGARPADNNMCTPEKRPGALGLPLAKQN